jgi:hypothetical protein
MMRIFKTVRLAVAALVALAFAGAPAPSQAASGDVHVVIGKASFIFGVSGGSGTLRFRGRSYPITIGGVSAGATAGLSKADLFGHVYNIRRPSDVAGTYLAGTAGAAIVHGSKVIRLHNEKGAVLELRGPQAGLEFSLDLSGMGIALR